MTNKDRTKPKEDHHAPDDAESKPETESAQRNENKDEEELEEGLEESFPGSDAPASTMRQEK